MSKPGFLVDASALYPLILELREKLVVHADKLAILDLTVYEVGNTLWKEYKRGRIRDLAKASRLLEEALSLLEKLEVDESDLEEALSIAVENSITFYDASYIHVARKRKLTLVTEDKDIRRAHENTLSVADLAARLREPRTP